MTRSLRARLLLATVVVAAIGLAAAGTATYVAFRSFLLTRLDEQLVVVADAAYDEFLHRDDPPDGQMGAFPDGTFAELRTGDGSAAVFAVGPPSPVSIAVPADLGLRGPEDERRFTLRGAEGLPDHRVLARSVPGEGALVVAVPVTEATATLGRLVAIEAVVAAVVLGLLTLLARAVIGVGLRPLDVIGATAAGIAAGDLTRRVPPADERTEIGRLAAALNAMLERIEAAFAESSGSRDRLQRFVADASHELRTPLTAIRGYAELFRRGAAERPDDLATAMRRIEEESVRMGVLVEDLLLLARLDEGPSLVRAPVDVAAVARDAVSDARAAAPDRRIDLAGDGPVCVLGDRDRLHQVAANLLSNARTHTPAGTDIRVATRSEDGLAVLEVADHGDGLAPDIAGRVFQRFSRSDGSRSRGSGGTGLGLSIVAAIVRSHGGRVAVESAPGRGATFRVELPLDGSAALPADLQAT